jgi:hypothetical protein
LLIVLAPASLLAGQEDFSSGAIKTTTGFLLVWNEEKNHYTLEIKGDEVRQTSTERKFFAVDGMFLQIVDASIGEFLEAGKRQTTDDRAILEAHRDWEVRFMEGEYGEKLKVESSWQKLQNGKDALWWQIEVPKRAGTNVTKQISLTTVNGDYVLMLGGVETDTIEAAATRRLLLATAETLKPSAGPIDLLKLQKQIREAPST